MCVCVCVCGWRFYIFDDYRLLGYVRQFLRGLQGATFLRLRGYPTNVHLQYDVSLRDSLKNESTGCFRSRLWHNTIALCRATFIPKLPYREPAKPASLWKTFVQTRLPYSVRNCKSELFWDENLCFCGLARLNGTSDSYMGSVRGLGRPVRKCPLEHRCICFHIPKRSAVFTKELLGI